MDPSTIAPFAGNCACQAQEHRLFNNCLNCGRILCVLDKGEACPSCGRGLDFAPDMSGLMQRLGEDATAAAAATSIYRGGSLVEAEALVGRLVGADADGTRDVIDEAGETAGYAKWESIHETRQRMERIQQKAEQEREERARVKLSTLLGLD